MSVNNDYVSIIINRALDTVNRDSSYASVEDAVGAAWKDVNAQRLNGRCDEDIAAAEHYLFCRYLIAANGVWLLPILAAMSNFYDLLKLLGIEYSEGSCPPSPPSIADSNWKTRGASDGTADYFGFTWLGHLRAPSSP